MLSIVEQGDLIFQQNQTNATLNIMLITFAENVPHLVLIQIEYFAIIFEVLFAKLWNNIEFI